MKQNNMKHETTRERLMELAAINNPFTNEALMAAPAAASEVLSMLAHPDMKKGMDMLADTLEDSEFMVIKKMYDALYEEVKKYEIRGGAIREATIPFPTWYNSFIQKLAAKLSERITGLDASDLRFEMVHPHLMGLEADMFNQGGLNFFPTAVRSVLKDPEFAGKAMMVWDNTGQIENKLVAKHPELEDFIYNEEMFWVYIK